MSSLAKSELTYTYKIHHAPSTVQFAFCRLWYFISYQLLEDRYNKALTFLQQEKQPPIVRPPAEPKKPQVQNAEDEELAKIMKETGLLEKDKSSDSKSTKSSKSNKSNKSNGSKDKNKEEFVVSKYQGFFKLWALSCHSHRCLAPWGEQTDNVSQIDRCCSVISNW